LNTPLSATEDLGRVHETLKQKICDGSKKGRLWLTDGSCIRLRLEYPNHVWSYDFVDDRTHDGRKFRMLNIIDEFTCECLAIRVNRMLKAVEVIDVLSDLFILRGVPGHICSDNILFGGKHQRHWASSRTGVHLIKAARLLKRTITASMPWRRGTLQPALLLEPLRKRRLP
jgi:hypothetical protein